MTNLLKTGPRPGDRIVRDAMSAVIDELVTMPEARRRGLARIIGRCSIGLSRDANEARRNGTDMSEVVSKWEDVLREVADTIACPRGTGR